MNTNDDILSENDETDEKTDKKQKKSGKGIIIFCIITAVYLAVCAVIYVCLDMNERNSYVKTEPVETRAAPGEWTEAEKININTATAGELCRVSGIGEVTAGKIIEYREKNGGFISLDELLNIGGIGSKTLEKIRPYLKV
ncbi:MAG: helix-hairpin-helix domain-containing protein [Ruminiclostridium sp.]|nr:helix-hairpin-helix domain-containing protein [Ruminiclostridium sp.]